jgi:hypothetical protein
MTRLYAMGFVFLLGVAAAGCSADEIKGGSPCDSSSPPATCSQVCGGTAPACPSGFYCATTGRCHADCDATAGTGCPAGQTCRGDGSCFAATDGGNVDGGPIVPVDGAYPDDNTCADVTLDGTLTTPNVILLVDRSRSMDTAFDGSTSRWDVLMSALIDAPSGLIPTLQHSVRFGLALYTGPTGGGGGGGTCPDLLTVLPPALDNLTAIEAVYRPNGPSGLTPTGQALDALVAALDGVTMPDGPTYIVLATDGEPNMCGSTGATTEGQAAAEAAATAAHTAGYTIDAIGVSTDVGLANLTLVANAGGGTAYTVTDTATLVAALNTIIGGAVSCDIALSGSVEAATACLGTVMLAGRVLPCDDPNGWRLVDSGHIVLQGTACTELTTVGGTVTARFPCGTAIMY